MSGGPSLKGKGGLVGFRKTLKVQGSTGGLSNKPSLMLREGWWVFEKKLIIPC